MRTRAAKDTVYRNHGLRKYAFLAVPIAVLATCVTILSQFIGEDLLIVYGILWLSVAALGLSESGSNTHFGSSSAFFFLGYLLLGILAMGLFLLSGESGYIDNLFLCLTKAMLMYFVGIALSSLLLTGNEFRRLAYVYVFCAAIYALWVQINYMPSIHSWLASEVYLFGKKNSFGQIAGVAVVLCAVVPKKSRIEKILAYSCALYLFSMIGGVQCRTAIIACIVALVAWLLFEKKYVVLGILFSACLVALIFVPQFQTLINHAFLLDKYADASLSTMSSGRLDYWGDAIRVIKENPISGVGDYYVDNFYLNAIANMGLIAGGILIVLIVSRFILCLLDALNVGKDSANSEVRYVLVILCGVLAIFYFVETILEAIPPIGPGTCSFLFWIACGYIDGSKAQRERGFAL